MVQFNKVRLTGFKSFVEPTELLIEPGMTGIVGPNGCGKSNLLEAMRWAMGETSSKKLRGGEMDDVIFGGSADRPARNLAEVSIYLDNSKRQAGPAYNDSEELEVTRRIERGQGSAYKVNGKDVRAKDVQLLFADLASGARSTALVSQGRIGALINSKPEDRRSLLEEAAGITGLHSRRHEAELRLRGAENNLERLEDVVTALEGQLAGLKRQSRQASRYRNISDHIRKTEAIVLHLRWMQASGDLDVAKETLRQIEDRLTQQATIVAEATKIQAEAAEILPDLRQKEAAAAAELHRLNVAREQLDAEEARLQEAAETAKARLVQITGDIERESELAADAREMLQQLEAERESLIAARGSETGAQADAEAAVEAAVAEVNEIEARLTTLTEQIAADDARRADMQRQVEEAETRFERLQARAASIAEERARLEADSQDLQAQRAAEAEAGAAEARLADARTDADASEENRAEAQAALEAARERMQSAEAALSRLTAEDKAIRDLLAGGESDDWTPVVEQLNVASGYEAALGAALGDDLSAATDGNAPLRWESLPPISSAQPLPAGAEPLNTVVDGPEALARRLSQIGVVPDAAAGARLRDDLAPGQRLVSRDGALWRWDGFTMAAGAPTAAATRLEQRNRLKDLEGELSTASAALEEHRTAFAAQKSAHDEAAAKEKAARATLSEAYAALSEARNAVAEMAEKASAATSRMSALDQAGEDLKADLGEADTQLQSLREANSGLNEPEGAREEQERLRAQLTERRAALVEAQKKSATIVREVEVRESRIETIGQEVVSWQTRAENGASQIEQLQARAAAAQTEIDNLADGPARIQEQRSGLLDKVQGAEDRRNQIADELQTAEAKAAELDAALKENSSMLADMRENRGIQEGGVRQAEQACETLRERISERLGCAPEGVLDAGALSEKERESLPEFEAAEAKLERLFRERDNMGPVNLRAEQEADELREQIESLGVEREDLTAAIAKFRQGIAELNREGRARLVESFEKVDTHFQDLFVRLFGGGRAHLKLTDTDDPLNAGLEIMASPPGKRLQTLSLLSGGEQALTALALLFAVFLTNPAPICVLDEVDAPLDDANVDRVCTLLEEMSESSSTRFIMITHHRMTMARMDRLFGVTMPERGVSQMVSVDLQQAEQIRESA